MSKVSDYNELFADLQKICDDNDWCNIFGSISLDELVELNSLLDRVIIFCDNIDEDDMYDYECGPEILKLGRLADTLLDRDLKESEGKYE